MQQPSPHIWNKHVETMDRASLEALQLERLQETVRRVYQNVPVYRERMQAAGVEPGDIRSLKDLRLLPFTQKTDLRDNYPYGLFAAPQEDIVRVHASSGTTGKPTVAAYTREDLDNWTELTARSLALAGIDDTSVVHIAYGYGLFTGGMGVHYGAERLGAAVVPASGGNTQRQLTLMEDFGATALCCTPSYAINLAEAMQEKGVDISRMQLKTGVFGAEPWSESMRTRIEKMLHIQAHDIYGLTEMMGPGVAMECEAKQGLHIWEDAFLPEILDEKQQAAPEGEAGELVITTLVKRGMPLLRYRTHDITCLTHAPCPCGCTHARLRRITGRNDDMLIIRGVNVFPSQVESVLLGFDFVTPNYQITVSREGALDSVRIDVEMAPGVAFDTVREVEQHARTLRGAIEQVLNIAATVRLVPPGTLERSEGKAKRVIDTRNLLD